MTKISKMLSKSKLPFLFASYCALIVPYLVSCLNSQLQASTAFDDEDTRSQTKAELAANIILTGTQIDTEFKNHVNNIRSNLTTNVLFFLSPEYFLGEESQSNTLAIYQMLKPGDLIGLYLKPSKKLLQYSSIPFKTGPTMWSPLNSKHTAESNVVESLLLSAFTPNELSRMIYLGKKLIESNLNTTVTTFMAHDWSSSPAIVPILQSAKIYFDFSPIPPEHIKQRLSQFNIYQQVLDTWSKISPSTLAYSSPESPGITFVPQNAASLDYLTVEEIAKITQKIAARSLKNPTDLNIINLSIYSDTLASHATDFKKILTYAASNNKISKGPLTLAKEPQNNLSRKTNDYFQRILR